MNALVKKFAKDRFPDAKSDLFACFIERGYALAKRNGHEAMVTMESWMFLSSYEKFRCALLQQRTLRTLAHFPYDGKRPTAMGINFGIAVVSAQNIHVAGYRGHYCCSRYYELADDGVPLRFPTPNERLKTADSDEFSKIPGSPVAYWVSDSTRKVYVGRPLLGDLLEAGNGLQTNDNDVFLRYWHEVALSQLGFDIRDKHEALSSARKWFPYNKGGQFRRWFGNREYVVDWRNDGEAVKTRKAADLKAGKITANNSKCWNETLYFRRSVTWSDVTSASNSFRLSEGSLFDISGPSAFPTDEIPEQQVLSLLNSRLASYLTQVLNPTMHFNVGNFRALPAAFFTDKSVVGAVDQAVHISRGDWDAYERSWDFQALAILTASAEPNTALGSSYTAWTTQNCETIAEMKRLEEENNRLFIDAYGLQNELTPEVPIEQITLTVNPAYRYGGKLTEEEQWTRFRQDTMQELISYAIGCAMGRYSLDAPGLIYAHSGNVGFEPSRYSTFPADADGIIPITDTDWFDDDAAHRVVEFISVAWDKTHFEENLRFLADNLSPKKDESSRETIRRYLCDSFFKDHLQTYKNRPIYWCFSSGKQKAFQCLVYLHRYNEGTLARMRMEYVVPLQSKMAARIDKLGDDIQAASTGAQAKRLQKERDKLTKQLDELRRFDEQLRHYADQRIALDLDDGVKVNYGKFGDLLAEVKAVTGAKAD